MTLTSAAFAATGDAGWPTLKTQIQKAEAPAGSALEKLIRANQDFSLLRPEEAYDKIRIPLWLRVNWRKAHPEGTYLATDPTGGYPLVLKEVAEWMEKHPDLRPGRPEPDIAPRPVKTSGGTNLRISGAATVSRSESDIRVNYWNTQKIIGGSNNIGGSGQQAQFYSSDGGATWGQTSLALQTGDSFHSDPTVDWTSDGTAWATTIGINSAGTTLKMRAYKSTNGGATWTFDNTFSAAQTNTDKQMMWVDHSATSAFKDNIYICWHNGNPQFVNRRTSAGWGTPIQISGAETTGTAIGCDIKTNSSGDVFVFWPATGNRRLLVAKSTNGGVSFGTPVTINTTFDSFDIGVPSFNGRRQLIYTSGGAYRTATKNMVYAVWSDLTGATGCTTATNEPGSNAASACKTRIWFARSSDGGATWAARVMINNQASLNDQYNPWLVVDETNGQIAVMYYDTVDDSTRKKTNVYYQASFDDGASWSMPFKVTTAQTDETIAGADSGNQYGDYNSLSGYAGTFFPSWTDRRSGAKEEIWTAAVTEGGGTCTPPAAPTGLTAASGSTGINLTWSAVAGATQYRILRSTTSGGPYTQIGNSATTSFSDTGLTCNTAYFYVVRALPAASPATRARPRRPPASARLHHADALHQQLRQRQRPRRLDHRHLRLRRQQRRLARRPGLHRPQRRQDLPLRRLDLHRGLRQQPLRLRPAERRGRHRGARRRHHLPAVVLAPPRLRERLRRRHGGGLRQRHQLLLRARHGDPLRHHLQRHHQRLLPAGGSRRRGGLHRQRRVVRQHDGRSRRRLQRRHRRHRRLRRPVGPHRLHRDHRLHRHQYRLVPRRRQRYGLRAVTKTFSSSPFAARGQPRGPFCF